MQRSSGGVQRQPTRAAGVTADRTIRTSYPTYRGVGVGGVHLAHGQSLQPWGSSRVYHVPQLPISRLTTIPKTACGEPAFALGGVHYHRTQPWQASRRSPPGGRCRAPACSRRPSPAIQTATSVIRVFARSRGCHPPTAAQSLDPPAAEVGGRRRLSEGSRTIRSTWLVRGSSRCSAGLISAHLASHPYPSPPALTGGLALVATHQQCDSCVWPAHGPLQVVPPLVIRAHSALSGGCASLPASCSRANLAQEAHHPLAGCTRGSPLRWRAGAARNSCPGPAWPSRPCCGCCWG